MTFNIDVDKPLIVQIRYMKPFQFLGSPEDVKTSDDIYLHIVDFEDWNMSLENHEAVNTWMRDQLFAFGVNVLHGSAEIFLPFRDKLTNICRMEASRRELVAANLPSGPEDVALHLQNKEMI